MDTNRAHPIRFISDPGSQIWGEFQRFVKTLARLLPQATDLEGFRTMCGAVKIDQKLILFYTRGRRFAYQIAKNASKIKNHELGEIRMFVDCRGWGLHFVFPAWSQNTAAARDRELGDDGIAAGPQRCRDGAAVPRRCRDGAAGLFLPSNPTVPRCR